MVYNASKRLWRTRPEPLQLNPCEVVLPVAQPIPTAQGCGTQLGVPIGCVYFV